MGTSARSLRRRGMLGREGCLQDGPSRGLSQSSHANVTNLVEAHDVLEHRWALQHHLLQPFIYYFISYFQKLLLSAFFRHLNLA